MSYAGIEVLLYGIITPLSPVILAEGLSLTVVLNRSSAGAIVDTMLPLFAWVSFPMTAEVLDGAIDELSGMTSVVVAEGIWLFEAVSEPVQPSVKKTDIRTSTDRIIKLFIFIVFHLLLWRAAILQRITLSRRLRGSSTALISIILPYYHLFGRMPR